MCYTILDTISILSSFLVYKDFTNKVWPQMGFFSIFTKFTSWIYASFLIFVKDHKNVNKFFQNEINQLQMDYLHQLTFLSSCFRLKGLMIFRFSLLSPNAREITVPMATVDLILVQCSILTSLVWSSDRLLQNLEALKAVLNFLRTLLLLMPTSSLSGRRAGNRERLSTEKLGPIRSPSPSVPWFSRCLARTWG